MANTDWWRSANVPVKDTPEAYWGDVRRIRGLLARRSKEERDAVQPETVMPQSTITKDVAPTALPPGQPSAVQELYAKPPTATAQAITAEVTAEREKPTEPPTVYEPKAGELDLPAFLPQDTQETIHRLYGTVKPDGTMEGESATSEWLRRIWADFKGNIAEDVAVKDKETGEVTPWGEKMGELLQDVETARAADDGDVRGKKAAVIGTAFKGVGGGALGVLEGAAQATGTALGALELGHGDVIRQGMPQFQEPALDTEGLSVQEQYPMARRMGSYAFGPLMETLQTDDPTKAGLGDLVERIDDIPEGESMIRAREDLERIKAGEDPVAVTDPRYNISAEFASEMLTDPMIFADILSGFGITSRLSRQNKLFKTAEDVLLEVMDEPELLKLRKYADDMLNASQQATQTLGQATGTNVQPIKHNVLEKFFWSTDNSRKEVVKAAAYDELASLLNLLDPMDPDGPKNLMNLVRKKNVDELADLFGAHMKGPKGQMLNDVARIIGDDLDKMPSLKATQLKHGEILKEFFDLADDALKKAYNISDVPGSNYVARFANWQRSIISELWLNKYLNPAYAIKNMTSDSANMVFDGVSPFKGRKWLEDFNKKWGNVAAGIDQGLGEGTPFGKKGAKSALPFFVPDVIKKVTKGGQNAARAMEEGRWARVYAQEFEKAFYHQVKSSPPPIPPGVERLIGSARANEIAQEVAQAANYGEKLAVLDRMLSATNQAAAQGYAQYLSTAQQTLMSDAVSELGRRFAALGQNVQAHQVQAVIKQYISEVNADYAKRLLAMGAPPPIAFSFNASVADNAAQMLENLAKQANVSALDPNGRWVRDVLREVNDKANAAKNRMALANRAMGLRASQLGTPDAFEVVVDAYTKSNKSHWDALAETDDVRKKLATALIGETKAKRDAAWARFNAVTGPAIWEKHALAREDVFKKSLSHLAALQNGAPLQHLLGRTRGQAAIDDIQRLQNLPSRIPNYVPTKMDLVNWADHLRFLEGERAHVDEAMIKAWQAARGISPNQMSGVTDTMFAAEQRAGLLTKNAETATTQAREAMLKGLKKSKDWSGDWQRYREDAQLIWQKARDEQRAIWAQAEKDIISGNFQTAASKAGAVGFTPPLQGALLSEQTSVVDGINAIGDGILNNWGKHQPNIAARGAAKTWLDKTAMPAHGDSLAVAKEYASLRTKDIMLDYGNIAGFDEALNTMFPFTFWYTRNGANWARRLTSRPAILGNYLRMRSTMEKVNESAGRRKRFEHTLAVKIPQAAQDIGPEWMGDTAHIDPTGMFLPFVDMARFNWDDPEEGAKGLRWVMNQTQKYGMRAFPAYEIAYETGWLRDGANVLNLPNAEMWGPAVEGNVGLQLPVTAPVQAVTAMAGIGGPEGINVEGPLREAVGLPRGEFYQPYRVSRMLSNMQEQQPTNTDLARIGLIAVEMANRWEDAKQVGRPWEEGDPISLAVQEEYNLSDTEMREVRDYMSIGVERAAKERAIPQLTGRMTGVRAQIEPTGERYQLGLQDMASAAAFPTDPQGSRGAVTDIRQAFPGGYVRQASYGAIPGVEEEDFGPVERSNWLMRKEQGEPVNEKYDKAIDDTLRKTPWDKKANDAYEDKRRAEMDAIKAKYPLPEITDDIPAVLWGMNPDEAADAVVEDWFWDLKGEPSYGEYGDERYDEWKAAHDKWMANLPKTFPTGTPTTGQYQGKTPEEGYRFFKQRYDSPLQATMKVYKDRISGPAWDAYWSNGKDYDNTVGRVRAMPAQTLIPMILEMYQNRWSVEELTRELRGVRFIPLSEQNKK